MSKVTGSRCFRLAALLILQASISACAHRTPSNWEVIRGERPELWAERPELSLVNEALWAVESWYVDPPDFSRFRLGALRGLEQLTPPRAFRVEEIVDGVAITYQVAGGAPATVRFQPSATHDATLRDLEIAGGIAQKVGALPDLARVQSVMIKEGVGVLDGRSTFFDRDTRAQARKDQPRPGGDVGLYLAVKEGVVAVVGAFEATPAEKAGIRRSDRVLAIDGRATDGARLEDVTRRLWGDVGTTVTITVARDDGEAPKEVTLAREAVTYPTVHARDLGDGVWYIGLMQFREDVSSKELAAALEEASRADMKGLILDVRSNPGGALTAAIEVAEQFLDEGTWIVYTRSRVSKQNMRFNAHAKKVYPALPMVVLVNEASAGAPEIVAGALQDAGRAIVLGTRTRGFGALEEYVGLRDGSVLRLVTARAFTPKGRPIQRDGIIPNIIVDGSEGGLPPWHTVLADDRQVQRALEVVRARTHW